MTRARYVYAIVAGDALLPPGLTGFRQRPVEAVRYRDLAAATGEVEPPELEPTVDAVLVHETVVETLQKLSALLPARFGTVLSDNDAVVSELSRNYDAFLADLERIGDKLEYGLTVLWQLPANTGATAEGHTVDATKSDRSDDRDGRGTRYLRALLAERQTEAKLQEKAKALWNELDVQFAPYYLDSRSTILPTPRIVVRAAHLLHPDAIRAYQEAFERTRAAHPELRFLLSGPWPPYSFVSPPAPDRKIHPLSETGTRHDQQEEVVHG